MNDIECYLKDLHELIHGSPIIANMIVFKISTGYNLPNLLGELRRMKKGVSYYDSVMNFCFEDVFNDLTNLEKQILFIMSISDNDEFFQISDLKFILESDDIDVSEAVSKLFRVSFCFRNGDQYACTSLVKMFSNKKMSKDKNIQITKITDKYYDWLKKKTELGVIENDLYVRAKAYNFERKSLVSEIRNILLDYDIYQNYDDTIAKIDKVILKDPTYAYIYFKKANFEKNSNKDRGIVVDAMEKAILNEPNHDYYLSEFAFYYSEIRENQKAIELFKKSLMINNENPSTHHGVALCYVKFYNNKNEYRDKAEIIVEHFEKGYFHENNRYANSHNARNAHAHARYLLSLGRCEEAKIVAKKGFNFAPNNGPLKTLYAEIQSAIDPNYVSTSKINDIRMGLFANASDEMLRKVVKMTNKKK